MSEFVKTKRPAEHFVRPGVSVDMRSQTICRRLDRLYPKFLHLLKPRWRALNVASGIASTGFCYLAAEVAYHALGGKAEGWVPKCAVYHHRGERRSHWWIERNGVRVDPTATQFFGIGKIPPYHTGRGCGFLTREPSRGAKLLLEQL